MLMKKIQRQDTHSLNTPPSVGPTTEAIPQTLAMYPCTFARSCTEYRSPTIVMVVGMIAPAPSPCTTRKTMSTHMFHAAPQKIEPSRKSAMPHSTSGLRPYRSDSLPYSGTDTACASR